jgi:hypothetical protein
LRQLPPPCYIAPFEGPVHQEALDSLITQGLLVDQGGDDAEVLGETLKGLQIIQVKSYYHAIEKLR